MQDLLGRADVAKAMIYTHVLGVGGGAVRRLVVVDATELGRGRWTPHYE